MSGTAKTYNWYKVAESMADFNWQANDLCTVELKGKTICVARKADQLFAMTAKCPHAGGHLCDGYIDSLQNVVCPLHRYKFSLTTGRNTSGEGYFLKTYPIEQRVDGIYIGMEESGFFSLFK